MSVSQSQIFNAMKAALDDYEVSYSQPEDEPILTFTLTTSGQMGSVSVSSYAYAVDGAILFYTVWPMKAKSETMAAVAEFICRANYGLWRGNFELDFRDGEVRYKAFVSCCGDEMPDPADIKLALVKGINMLDMYGDGLVRVMLGVSDDPAGEVAKAEAKAKAEAEA